MTQAARVQDLAEHGNTLHGTPPTDRGTAVGRLSGMLAHDCAHRLPQQLLVPGGPRQQPATQSADRLQACTTASRRHHAQARALSGHSLLGWASESCALFQDAPLCHSWCYGLADWPGTQRACEGSGLQHRLIGSNGCARGCAPGRHLIQMPHLIHASPNTRRFKESSRSLMIAPSRSHSWGEHQLHPLCCICSSSARHLCSFDGQAPNTHFWCATGVTGSAANLV